VLDGENICLWDGNYHALEVNPALGLKDSGGMLRVGPVYYTTVEEMIRFGEVLGRISDSD